MKLIFESGINLLSRKLRDLLPLTDVKRDSSGLAFTVSTRKLLQSILPSSNHCDLSTCLNQAISHRSSNTGGGSD